VLADRQLGRRLRSLIDAHGPEGLISGRIIATAQDLLGEDTSLLPALRDLLRHPGLLTLYLEAALGPRLAGRDALLEDLAATYNTRILRRLDCILSEVLEVSASTHFTSAPGTAGGAHVPPADSGFDATAHADSIPAPGVNHAQPGYSRTSEPRDGGAGPASGAVHPSPLALLTLTTAFFAILAVLLALLLALRREPQTALGNPIPASGGDAAPPPRNTTAAPRKPSGERREEESATAQQHLQDSSADDIQGSETPDRANEDCSYQAKEGAEMEQYTCTISRYINANQDRVVRVTWSDGKSSAYVFRADGSVETWFQGKQDFGSYRQQLRMGARFVRIDAQKDRDITWLPASVLD